MIHEIRVAVSPGEYRVALLREGRLTDYAIHRPGAPDGVGDLHCGRVVAQVPAMAGAFVALADAEGFLPDSEGAKGLTVGTLLTVAITRAAQGGKGPRLTARVPEIQADAIRLLRHGPDAIARFAALDPDAPIAVDDHALAARLRPQHGPRLTVVPAAFDDPLADAIAALAEPTAALPAGACLHIQPTPALTAIDIDAGSATGLAMAKSAAQAELNRAVLPELGRQIRLRNLSGAILVDLAGMKARRRASLGPALADALAGDPLQPQFLGFTALGLAEIQRRRIHAPLHERLAGPHAAGLAALRAAAARIAADPARKLVLRTTPAVTTALQNDLRGPRRPCRTGRPALDAAIGSGAPSLRLGVGGGDMSIPCPICGKPAAPKLTPFCSGRCADVDLGRWLTGHYVIPGPPADLDEDPPPGSTPD